MNMQTALQGVGYKSTKPKPTIDALLDAAIDPATKPRRSTIAAELQTLWEHNLAYFGGVDGEVQFERAGSYFRARYRGQPTACFGETKAEATKRLEFWRKHGQA